MSDGRVIDDVCIRLQVNEERVRILRINAETMMVQRKHNGVSKLLLTLLSTTGFLLVDEKTSHRELFMGCLQPCSFCIFANETNSSDGL